MNLRGKHVVVTGAGGGIGRALVAGLLEAEASVTACDRDPALLADLDGVDKAVFELVDREGTAAAVQAILQRRGAPAALIGNAGFTRAETVETVDGAAWDSELAINLTGTYNLVTPFLKPMIAAGGGSIVLVSSVNGLAYYGNPAYSAAKAGLIAYAEGLAVEQGRHGIRANCVCPGSVRTPAWDHRLAAKPSLLAEVSLHYPLGRLVTPQEVTNAVLFLASPLSSGITGTALAVDAGLTAGNLRFVRDIIGG